MTKIIQTFGLKLINKPRKVTSTKPVRVSKKVVGECFIEDGIYKVHVELESKDALEVNPAKLVLEFTEDSYSLKGKDKAFNRCKTNEDKWVCYCRTRDYATVFPGNKTAYVPFAAKWLVLGYVVRVNKQLMFEHRETLTIKGYNYEIIHKDEDD